MRHPLALLTAALALAACTTTLQDARAPLAGRYVAMGSSFAAGPGVTVPADTPPDRCSRSKDNYARQLARRRGLELVDVSCSGATTQALLKPWGKLPAQLDALTPDTALVTITIGGNDVGYIGGLMAASCASQTSASPRRCPPAPTPSDAAFQKLEASLLEIIAQVRLRAPRARLVFVDYPVVLPERGSCAATPLPPQQAQAARAVARRLAETTARAAKAGGAEVLKASALSRGHDACAADPWMNGYPHAGARPSAPYHPNLAGMTAVAEGLDRMLGR